MEILLYRPATLGLSVKALGALAFLLGAFYVFLAVKNLRGDPQMLADYQRWGCTEGFRLLVACAQLSFGLLLCCRPLAFWGALPLALMMIGAIWIHARHDTQPRTWIPAAVFCALCATLAFALRPALLRG